jgi:hypothetical protein
MSQVNKSAITLTGVSIDATKGTFTESIVASDAYFASGINTIGIAKNNLITHNGYQYIAYINSNLLPVLLKKNLTTGQITAYDPLPGLPNISTFSLAPTDDEHGIIALSIDNQGYLHLAYGMHNISLVYYKSNNPNDPSSWSSVLPMLGTNENSVTYPMFIKNPANGELYFTFRNGGSGNGNQYFYHYNTVTFSWEPSLGTGVAGLLIEGTVTPHSAYLNGLPKWNTNGTVLHWNWEWDNTGINQYYMYWNGSSFFKYGGTSQSIPATDSNLSPIITTSGMTTQNDFNVDINGTIFIPYEQKDSFGNYQTYVSESSTGNFVTHQLSSNIKNIIYNTLGPTVIPFGSFVYIVYPNIWDAENGIVALQSSDNFYSFKKFFIGHRYNPNWTINYDSTAYYDYISFLYMDSNDPQYGVSYVDTNLGNVNKGQLTLVKWIPSLDVGTSKGMPTDLYGLNVVSTKNLCISGPLNATRVDFTGISGVAVNVPNYTNIQFSKSDGTVGFWQIFSDNSSGIYATPNGFGIFCSATNKSSMFFKTDGTVWSAGNLVLGTVAGVKTVELHRNSDSSGALYIYDGLGNVLSANTKGGFGIASGGVAGWTASSTSAVVTLDSGMSRSGPASIAIGNGTLGDASGKLSLAHINLNSLVVYTSNAAAIAGGLAAGDVYRTGTDPDVVCIVH